MRPLSTLYRTAFVTGASAGLGRAHVDLLLSEGVKVWGTARTLQRLDALAAKPGFKPVVVDLDEPAGALRAFQEASAEAGGFELVVNNAGYGVFAPFAHAEFETWQKQVNAMLTTTALLAHAALRPMVVQGRGCLVNVASLATDFTLPFMSGYNVAKAGLSALSESLIFETRGTGVVVIDFRPGDYRTAFNHSMRNNHFQGVSDARLERAWRGLEQNLKASPEPQHAARALAAALRRRRSGVVRCGGLFQARVAPLFVRFAPDALRRFAMRCYFGAS